MRDPRGAWAGLRRAGAGTLPFVRITWTFDDENAGAAEADSVDGAADTLASAVRAAYAEMDALTLAHIMLNVVTPVRERMVNEGRAEVERGRDWTTSQGPINVTLHPN